MKTAWLVLLISAIIDGGLAAVTGVMSVLAVIVVTAGKIDIQYVMFLSPMLGGLAVALRTIQSALAATPANTAALRGDAVTTVTKLPGSTVIQAPTEARVAEQAQSSALHVLDKGDMKP